MPARPIVVETVAVRRRRPLRYAIFQSDAFYRTLTESGSAADALSETLAAMASLAESGSALDNVLGVLGNVLWPHRLRRRAVNPRQPVPRHRHRIAVLLQSAAYVASLTETGNATDALTETLAATANLTEAGSASDALTALLSTAATLAETGSAADALTAALAAALSLSETGAASDTPTLSVTLSIAESGSAADVLSAAMAAVVSLFENGSAQDFLSIPGGQRLHAFLARMYWGWKGN